MPQLTTKQRKRLEKIKQVIQMGDLGVAKMILELEDKLEEEIPQIKNIISRLKGDKGDDYVLTKEDKQEIASEALKLLDKQEVAELAVGLVNIDALAKLASKKVKLPKIYNKAEIRDLVKPIIPAKEDYSKVHKALSEKITSLENNILGLEIPEPLAVEDFRNGLEVLQGDERLKFEAIRESEDILKDIDELKKRPVGGRGGGNPAINQIAEDGSIKYTGRGILNFTSGLDVTVDGNEITISPDLGEITGQAFTLQEVTDNGATTTNDIEAAAFVTTGADNQDFTMGDGDTRRIFGEKVIIVDSSGSDTDRGTALRNAYAEAKLLFPTATNWVKILVPEGIYDMGGSQLVHDTKYIKIAAMTRSTIRKAIAADDVYSYSSYLEEVRECPVRIKSTADGVISVRESGFSIQDIEVTYSTTSSKAAIDFLTYTDFEDIYISRCYIKGNIGKSSTPNYQIDAIYVEDSTINSEWALSKSGSKYDVQLVAYVDNSTIVGGFGGDDSQLDITANNSSFHGDGILGGSEGDLTGIFNDCLFGGEQLTCGCETTVDVEFHNCRFTGYGMMQLTDGTAIFDSCEFYGTEGDFYDNGDLSNKTFINCRGLPSDFWATYSTSAGATGLRVVNSFLWGTDTVVNDGDIEGTKFVTNGGTSSQFVKGDGSLDSSTYLTTIPTHTGEVTGDTSLTLNKTAISNRSDVTMTASDILLFGDTSDSANLKKGAVQDVLDLVTPAGSDGDLQINASGVFGTIGGLTLDQTGNTRGTGALDIQSYRSAATEVASGANSVTYGQQNSATAANCVAIGYNNDATGKGKNLAMGIDNTASGYGLVADGENIAIGKGNSSTGGPKNITIGYANNVSAKFLSFSGDTIAIGRENTASAGGTNSTLIGRGNESTGSNGLGIGYGNEVVTNGYAIGYGNTNGAGGNMTVGATCSATGPQSISMGYASTASGYYNTAIGNGCTASGYYAGIAMGYYSESTGTYSTAVGTGTISGYTMNTASGQFSTAVGHSNLASGQYAHCVGNNNIANSTATVAVGYFNTASAVGANAIGTFATASGTTSIGIGYVIGAFTDNDIVLGTGLLSGGVLASLNVSGGKLSVSNYNPLAGMHSTGDILATDISSLGSDLVSNGDFDGDAADWTLGTGWTYSANKVTKDGDGTGTLSQSLSITAGKYYLLKFEIGGFTAGTLDITLGGASVPTMNASSNGQGQIYQATFLASTTGDLIFTPSNTARISSIDNVVVKEITAGDILAPMGNVHGKTGTFGSVSFTQELDNGSKTASFTVDFSTDNNQKATLTANTITLTLDTTDIGVGSYILKLVNGGLATLTWAAESGSVKWSGGTAPTLTSSGTDIITFYYDGTDFYGVDTLNFS